MNVSISPIIALRDRNKEEAKLETQKPIDSKIQLLCLAKIGQTKGILLPNAVTAEVEAFVLPKRGKVKLMHKKRKHKLRKNFWPRKAPIGLMPSDPEGWVNALMQFMLFIPGLAECFLLAPRSLAPIWGFMDQYTQDMNEGHAMSTAQGSLLTRLFAAKFPQKSLCEVIESLIHQLIPKWGIFRNIYDALKRPRPSDLFLSVQGPKKQLYADPGEYYDLDAFIEKRPDGGKTNYVAFVKVEGCWYQCDDERITQLRSDLLTLPLQRALIAHYKQVRCHA